eukprot:1277603-Rhodomonas_salina.1
MCGFAGAFAIAFVLVKLTGPVRLMFDIAITPTLAGYLRGTWLAGPRPSAPRSPHSHPQAAPRQSVAARGAEHSSWG